jgi:hypothetical protein
MWCHIGISCNLLEYQAMKRFLSILLASASSFARVDCPANYPSGGTLTYSSGAMNYPSGGTLRYSNGAMNYPSGGTLRYSNGAMNYESGGTLRYSNGAMNYPSGGTLRTSSGSLNDASGGTNTTGSVSLSTKFGSSQMRIIVRSDSAKFQTTIPYGEGIMLVEFDEEGNVTCTVEGGATPTEFRVDGDRGTAYVTVKPGQNANLVKAAVQKALDGH